jgi:hypothetical protein
MGIPLLVVTSATLGTGAVPLGPGAARPKRCARQPERRRRQPLCRAKLEVRLRGAQRYARLRRFATAEESAQWPTPLTRRERAKQIATGAPTRPREAGVTTCPHEPRPADEIGNDNRGDDNKEVRLRSMQLMSDYATRELTYSLER